MTVDNLLFTRVEEEDVIDSIPLHEITSVTLSDGDSVLELTTLGHGYNSGRPYALRSTNEFDKTSVDVSKFTESLRPLISAAIWRAVATSSRWKHLQYVQYFLKRFYDSTHVQILIAAVIAANFIANVVEKQVSPEAGSALLQRFDNLEISFTVLFALEICINLCVNWWKPFVNDGAFPDRPFCPCNVYANVCKLSVNDGASFDSPFRPVNVFRNVSNFSIMVPFHFPPFVLNSDTRSHIWAFLILLHFHILVGCGVADPSSCNTIQKSSSLRQCVLTVWRGTIWSVVELNSESICL